MSPRTIRNLFGGPPPSPKLPELVPWDRATLSDVLQFSSQECFTRHQERFPGLGDKENVSNLAATLVVWLMEDPRVMDFFPYGLPLGPVHTEHQGNLEAKVFDEYSVEHDPDRGTFQWQGRGRFYIRCWRAEVPQAEPWKRRHAICAADVGDAVSILKKCRAWIRAEQKRLR